VAPLLPYKLREEELRVDLAELLEPASKTSFIFMDERLSNTENLIAKLHWGWRRIRYNVFVIIVMRVLRVKQRKIDKIVPVCQRMIILMNFFPGFHQRNILHSSQGYDKLVFTDRRTVM